MNELDAQVKQAISANAESGIGFSPRFVARCLGIPITEVLNMCDRQQALGLLERYTPDPKVGEVYFRRPRAT